MFNKIKYLAIGAALCASVYANAVPIALIPIDNWCHDNWSSYQGYAPDYEVFLNDCRDGLYIDDMPGYGIDWGGWGLGRFRHRGHHPWRGHGWGPLGHGGFRTMGGAHGHIGTAHPSAGGHHQHMGSGHMHMSSQHQGGAGHMGGFRRP